MKAFRIIAATGFAAAMLVAALPASAQFFPGFPDGGGFYRPQRPRYYEPQYQQPDYQQQYRQPDYQQQYRQPDYDQRYRRPDYQQRPDYSYAPRRGAYGNACYTTRGSCSLEYSAPVNSQCRCFIPGFGKKHGSVYQQ